MILVGYLFSESSELNATNLPCSLKDFGMESSSCYSQNL